MKGVSAVASQSVKMVLNAEADAGKMLAEARSKADDIIAAAEADANTGIQKAISRARTDAGSMRETNSRKAAEYEASVNEKYAVLQKQVRDKADKNLSAAVDEIIGKFF